MSDSLRALVVDDDEPIRRMIARVLERDGFLVDTARDGAEAIDLIDRDEEYRLIVLDLMMPHVDGFGVLRHLREADPSQLEHVVVATAMFPTVELDEPVAAVLRKPFDLADLRHVASRFRDDGEATA